MNKQDIKRYEDKRPIAVFPMSNWGGVEILDIEHGIDDYAICRYYGKSYHRVRIRYGVHETSFRIGDLTFNFKDCLLTA